MYRPPVTVPAHVDSARAEGDRINARTVCSRCDSATPHSFPATAAGQLLTAACGPCGAVNVIAVPTVRRGV